MTPTSNCSPLRVKLALWATQFIDIASGLTAARLVGLAADHSDACDAQLVQPEQLTRVGHAILMMFPNPSFITYHIWPAVEVAMVFSTAS